MKTIGQSKKEKTGGDEDSEKIGKKTRCRKSNDTIEYLREQSMSGYGKKSCRSKSANRK